MRDVIYVCMYMHVLDYPAAGTGGCVRSLYATSCTNSSSNTTSILLSLLALLLLSLLVLLLAVLLVSCRYFYYIVTFTILCAA